MFYLLLLKPVTKKLGFNFEEIFMKEIINITN
jgi:hypothetical protein